MRHPRYPSTHSKAVYQVQQKRLTDVAKAFDELETIDISIISLMVRRDYATANERKRAKKLRKERPARLRGHLRLVRNDEQS